jgi:hypothetical protein
VLPAVMSNACCQQPALCEDLLTYREHVLELHQEGDHALHQVLLHHRAHKLALGGRKEGRQHVHHPTALQAAQQNCTGSSIVKATCIRDTCQASRQHSFATMLRHNSGKHSSQEVMGCAINQLHRGHTDLPWHEPPALLPGLPALHLRGHQALPSAVRPRQWRPYGRRSPVNVVAA